MVTNFLDRIRAALRQDGVTPAGLAKKAGLHRNTLYGAERDDWNPTAAILTALEPHIDAIERDEWKEPPSDELPDTQTTPRKQAA